ncbi:MAG: hypothetical protein GEU78_18345 [Actinobacteria bacterium]|nr:hypothetical protein [Actinomycetota bacterium]
MRDFQGLPGAVWHPDEDAWEVMTPPPVPPPWPEIAMWTGDEVLIWGGEGPLGGEASGLAWRP